jgi:site-specific recombinase XerD
VTSHLQDLQRSFLRELNAEKRSPNTLRLYGQAITFFSRWLESEGREATLEELNRPAIREWLAVLADTHEPGTVKIRYRGLYRFLFLARCRCPSPTPRRSRRVMTVIASTVVYTRGRIEGDRLTTHCSRL